MKQDRFQVEYPADDESGYPHVIDTELDTDLGPSEDLNAAYRRIARIECVITESED